MIGALALAAATQALPNAPGAVTPAPLLIDCLFPRTAPAGTKPKMDEFAVLLTNGLTVGAINSSETSDPNGLIGGGHFDTSKTGKDGEITLLGIASTPQTILTMFPSKSGPQGYDAGIGTVHGGGPRLGRQSGRPGRRGHRQGPGQDRQQRE